MSKKIVLGMSGGVDSSAAAWLLKQDGWDVTGVMLRLWTEDTDIQDQCIAGARAVCEAIGIPFILKDERDFFYEKVVRDFSESYLNGHTPNPCTTCNSTVRWLKLREAAAEVGADLIATGHYARLEQSPLRLLRGTDAQKDQSYVLAQLSRDDLEHTVLPLGTYTKTQIRAIAAEQKLPTAQKPDSQDICFIGDGDYRRFLKQYCGDRIAPGDIVDENGAVIGHHDGLPFYTVGQRRGLFIYAPEPSYVLDKDIAGNRLIVGTKGSLSRDVVRIDRLNRIHPAACGHFEGLVQLRYRSVPQPAFIEIGGDGSAVIYLKEARSDIACGQLAVIYLNDAVAASGRIIAAERGS